MKYLVMVLFLFTCVESMVVYSQNKNENINYSSSSSHHNPSNSTNHNPKSQDNPLADEQLEEKINAKLSGLSMQFGQITIKARNGVVTVSGPLQSLAQKIAIIQAIKSVEGVKSVDAKDLAVPEPRVGQNTEKNK